MRSRSPVAWAIVVLAVVFAVVNLGATIHRSLIPVAVDDVIAEVEVRREKHPGVDDVWLVHTADRSWHVDAPIGQQLQPGQRISKGAWGRQLRVEATDVPLRLSRDAMQMLWLMPLLVGLTALLLWRPRRT